MATTTVAVETASESKLFEGLSFYLSVGLPARSTYRQRIEEHGGRVLRIEGNENYKIGDHLRRPFIPGFHSYTFIDVAIRDGKLPDPEEHKIASNSPPRRGRNQSRTIRVPFTPQDDRDLVEYVERVMETRKANNIGPKGNKIYQSLQELNPRHPAQSWRNRYIGFTEADIARIKASGQSQNTQTSESTSSEQPMQAQLDGADRPVTPPNELPQASQQSDVLDPQQQMLLDELTALKPVAEMTKIPFTANELAHLVVNFDSVKDIQEDRLDEAWAAFAECFESVHSAADWASLCYKHVEPIHARLKEERKRAAETVVQRAATLPPLDARNISPPIQQPQNTMKRRANDAEGSPAKRQQRGDANGFSMAQRMSEPPIQRTRRTPEMAIPPIPQEVTEDHSDDSSPLMRVSQPSDQRLQWTFDQALHKKRTEDSASVASQSSHRLTAKNLANQFEQQSAEEADDAQSVAAACMQYIEETRRHTAPESQTSSKSSGRRQFVSSQESAHFEEEEPAQHRAKSMPSPSQQLPSDGNDVEITRLSQDASGMSEASKQYETCREEPVSRSPERRLPNTIQDSNSQSPHSQQQSQSQQLSLGSGYSQLRFFEPDLGVPSPAKIEQLPSKSQSPLFVQDGSPQSQVGAIDQHLAVSFAGGNEQADAELVSSQESSQQSDGSSIAFEPAKSVPTPALAPRRLPFITAQRQAVTMPVQRLPPQPSTPVQAEAEVIELSDDTATSPSTHNAQPFPARQSNVQELSKLDKFKMTYEKKGASNADIISALKQTTMNTDLAAAILLAKLHDHKVRENQPGIWSQEEDAIVMGHNTGEMVKLVDKHGRQRFAARKQFLVRMGADQFGRF